MSWQEYEGETEDHIARKGKEIIHGRRTSCAAKPCWRSRANTRSITIFKGKREATGAVRASQAEIREMSHSATNFLCDLGQDVFISKLKCFK